MGQRTILVTERQIRRLLADVASLPAAPVGAHLDGQGMTEYVLGTSRPEDCEAWERHAQSCLECLGELEALFEATTLIPASWRNSQKSPWVTEAVFGPALSVPARPPVEEQAAPAGTTLSLQRRPGRSSPAPLTEAAAPYLVRRRLEDSLAKAGAAFEEAHSVAARRAAATPGVVFHWTGGDPQVVFQLEEALKQGFTLTITCLELALDGTRVRLLTGRREQEHTLHKLSNIEVGFVAEIDPAELTGEGAPFRIEVIW